MSAPIAGPNAEANGDKNATPVRVKSLSKSFGQQKVLR